MIQNQKDFTGTERPPTADRRLPTDQRLPTANRQLPTEADKQSTIIVIGAGFSGLSAASFMAKEGCSVTVIEKNEGPGGRAGQLKENGFDFDRGPSFYWMPDVFEKYFACFGKSVSDYYSLERLDPSYRIYWPDGYSDIPADFDALKNFFESLEPGSAAKLESYIKEAGFKYRIGMENLVYKPGLSFTEFLDWSTIRGILRLDVFTSIRKHIHKNFQHPRLRQLLEFPVLFLGALPEDTPALYSLMNYADFVGGTWYPKGGMFSVVKGMYRLALELGVSFKFGEEVQEIVMEQNSARTIITDQGEYSATAVISAADYHFTETNLLAPKYRSYNNAYWEKKVMAPSCLMYYVGLNKKLRNALHHSLFFDTSLEVHGKEIYRQPAWPSAPLFYVSIPSVSDAGVAPAGSEAMVLLVPVAAGLDGDSEALRQRYFEDIIRRLELHTGEKIIDAIIYKKTYSVSDFENDYHSFRGNAYGLANTLKQTAIFRPSCRSKKVDNLFYAGQLTVPGPGVPPSLISGEVAAGQLIKMLRKKR